MAKSTHTPGPWRITGPNIRADTDLGTGALIATVEHHWHTRQPYAKFETSGTELDANARLIASAPDLLAALEYCLEYLNANPDEYSGPRAQAARAAIEKATGDSANTAGPHDRYVYIDDDGMPH
jgi:hypothetical protein